MNLPRFQSVFVICLLLLVFGLNQIKSTTPDEGYCGFSDVEEDMCSSYCYKSIKAPLSYILELKEQIKAKTEEQIDTDNEIRELRKRLVDLTDYRNHIKSLNDHIEDGEFFIGLENLHRITNLQRYELYIEMKNFEGDVEFARYDNFRIGNENEKYKLESIGDFRGTAVDYLQWYVGAKFSTYDQDNDGDEDLDFAEFHHGSWWYKRYYGAFTNLNGRYYKSEFNYADVMHWDKPLKSVQMLIRPKSK